MNYPLLRICLLILLIVTGFGCQSPGPRLPALESAPLPVNPIPTKVLNQLLTDASSAFDDDRLVFPEDGSAFSIYQNILEYYPGQNQARRGIEDIVEKYLQLAIKAADRGQLANGRSMLARARLVDETHPGIAATQNRLDWLTDATRQIVRLDNAQVRARSGALIRRLTDLGTRAKAKAAQVVITARSDTDGRWIYQQMKKGEGEERVHAQLQIGSPTSVAIMASKPES